MRLGSLVTTNINLDSCYFYQGRQLQIGEIGIVVAKSGKRVLIKFPDGNTNGYFTDQLIEINLEDYVIQAELL